MATFLYECPTTGLKVQGWFADDVSESGGNTYELVTCLACQSAHLINPTTGKTLGSDEE